MKKHFCILLALTFVLFIYSNVITFDSISWDDNVQVFNNLLVNSPITFSNLINIFSSSVTRMYQPLTTLSYTIELSLLGRSPSVFHFFSVFFHLINTLICYLILLQIFPKKNYLNITLSLLIFSIHPINTEAICWISARSTLFHETFYLSGILSYFYYLKSKKELFYIITLILFLFSLLSKVMAVSFPFLIVFMDYIFNKTDWNIKKNRMNVFLRKIPFFFLSVLFAIPAILIRNKDLLKAINNSDNNFWYSPFTFIYQYVLYIKDFLIPLNLKAQYNDPIGLNFDESVLILLFLLALYLVYKLRDKKELLFGVILFLIPLIPVLKLKPIGHSFIANRYFYISSFGLIIILYYLISKIKQTKIISALLIVLILPISYLTINRQNIWKNDITIWTETINSSYKHVSFAYEARAIAFIKKNEFANAIADLNTAIELSYLDNDIPKYTNQLYTRATILFHLRKKQEAINDLRKILSKKPNYNKAVELEKKILLSN